MFTDTMTLTEMQKEVGKDYDPLFRRIYHFQDETRRFFLKSKTFPVYKVINWKSYVTNGRLFYLSGKRNMSMNQQLFLSLNISHMVWELFICDLLQTSHSSS